MPVFKDIRKIAAMKKHSRECFIRPLSVASDPPISLLKT